MIHVGKCFEICLRTLYIHAQTYVLASLFLNKKKHPVTNPIDTH